MELSQIRRRIDELNGELLRLFEERMALCAQVAEEKKKNGMEVFAPVREVEILNQVRQKASPELVDYDVSFFNGLMSPASEPGAGVGGDTVRHPDRTAGAVPSGYAGGSRRLFPDL